MPTQGIPSAVTLTLQELQINSQCVLTITRLCQRLLPYGVALLQTTRTGTVTRGKGCRLVGKKHPVLNIVTLGNPSQRAGTIEAPIAFIPF